MILALFTLTIWTLSLLGWGAATRRLLCTHCQRLDSLDYWGVAGLLGIATATAIATLVSFLFGLGGTISVFFLSSGILLLFKYKSGIWKCKFALSEIALAIAILMLAAIWSARPILSGDTGIYHMQAVQWIAGQPVVPGLANLHGRFGFNSAWWIFAALLEVPSLSGFASHLANPLLLIFCGFIIASAWKRFLTGSCRTFDAIPLCATFLWLRQGISWNTPSLSNDTPANLLVVMAVYLATRGLEAQRSELPGERSEDLIVATILGFFLFTIKLNAVVLMAGLAVTAFWIFRGNRPLFFGVLAAATFFLFPWIARGYLLSGYPAYPSTMGGINVFPWKTPKAQAISDAVEIRSWPTRNEGSSQPLFTRWLDNQMGRGTLIAGAVIGAASLGFAFTAFRKGLINSYLAPAFLIPFFVAACGVAFVLLTAPAFRFLSGYAFSLAGLFAGPGIALLSQGVRTVRITTAVLVVLPSLTVNTFTAPRRPLSFLAFPPLPAPDVFPSQTSDGVKILVTGSTAMTWNAPRPATMGFDPGIRVMEGPSGTIRMFLPPSH